MQNGNNSTSVGSTSAFVGRHLRRFAVIVIIVTLLICLVLFFAVMRANSNQICSIVGTNVQSYLEPLSREIIIGNQEYLATILENLKRSHLLRDVSVKAIDTPLNAPQIEQCQLNWTSIEFTTPIMFGQRQVAVLEGSILWIPFAQIAAVIGLAALGLLAFMWLSTRSLLRNLNKVLITPIGQLARGEVLEDQPLTSDVLKIKRDLDASQENAKYAAVAQLTQALAHDVRKPFSMLQILMQEMKKAKTLSEMKNSIESGSQAIDRALTSVTGMLTDIMEIGRETTQKCEAVSPKALIQASMQEVCKLYPCSDIDFLTEFKHHSLLRVDPNKVQRVFSNIVENAVQAMDGTGCLWFRTSELSGDGFIELVIGNSGSCVAPEDQQKIFDAFFTKNKKDGTGLGLSIAKKIVITHGGQIGCKALSGIGMEFWFTLPIVSQVDSVDIAFPKSIIEVHRTNLAVIERNSEQLNEEAQSEILEREIVHKLNGHHIKVMVLEDEELYRDALIRIFKTLDTVGPYIDLLVARSSDEAIAQAVLKPDIGLFDYDLGRTSLNGVETLKFIRQIVPDIYVWMHSNHICGNQYKEAIDAGAAHFLPKPLTKIHVLNVINRVVDANQDTFMLPASNDVVAVVDDCEFIRNAWIKLNAEYPLITFESPEAFWKHVNTHPDFFNSLALIVTDQFFGQKSLMTGIEFSKSIVGKPVVLSSVGNFDTQLPIDGISAVLPKKVLEWSELRKYFVSNPNLKSDLSANGSDMEDRHMLQTHIVPIAKTNKQEFLSSLKVKFLDSSIDIINDIEIAKNKNDAGRVKDLLHKLQGAAMFVNEQAIVDACRMQQDGQISDNNVIELTRKLIYNLEQKLRDESLI